MKIVYLNPVGVLGGGERNLLDIMAAVHEANPEAELHLVCGSAGPLVEATRNMGIDVTVVSMPDRLARLGDSDLKQRSRMSRLVHGLSRLAVTALSVPRYAQTLRRVIEGLAPDIVHSNGIKCHLLTPFVVPRSIPVVWQIQDYLGSRTLVPHLMRCAAKGAARMIAISESVAEDVRRVIPGTSVKTVYSAIDTDAFSPASGNGEWLDDLAAFSPTSDEVLRIGLVATYARWKGHAVFLEAASRLATPAAANHLRFYVVGGPLYATNGSQYSESELRELAARLGVTDQVGFVPFQERIADVYRSLDIVVHASTQPEPFGRTIVEAMSCARPVVVAAAGGAAELIDDGETALAAEPGCVSSLCAALHRLICEPTLRRQVGDNARAAACERFSRSRLAGEICAQYSQVGTNLSLRCGISGANV